MRCRSRTALLHRQLFLVCLVFSILFTTLDTPSDENALEAMVRPLFIRIVPGRMFQKGAIVLCLLRSSIEPVTMPLARFFCLCVVMSHLLRDLWTFVLGE